MIKVKAYADLTKYITKEQGKFETNFNNKGKEFTVEEIINYYGIPREKIQIILVNGLHSDVKTVVKDGDTVVFFSPVGGG
ncbi:molybdenum cofactor biosynthesis protein MoaD [Deferribacter autotrophicus]|uniref:Molybdenum cofactor biosynthesis protein MoaD n=1 Tax=Deferribacter autotrophicus TaxID=500465 RepID=A0A5A8F273_9BACT|nr:MoaD/ThiS family protein [Deferribacter autotrophicus]KAA0257425.1 molybdenum cofactor biosynthesis protein MoaD [Deferribacter autotrophicus]